MEVWEDRAREEGMCSWRHKKSSVQSKDFPLSGSKVTHGEQLCGKDHIRKRHCDELTYFFFSP